MTRRKQIWRILVIFQGLIFVATGPGLAQQTFNTTVYFDYTTFLSKEGPITSAAKNNYFAFRRAYFTYENKISDTLKLRFRYDADNTANLTSVNIKTGAIKKDDKLRPFMKHLYLDYSGFLPGASLKIGMTETLTFKLAEDRWGYRSVAKTIVDGYIELSYNKLDPGGKRPEQSGKKHAEKAKKR